MNENAIRGFWEQHPCGDGQIGGLERYRDNYEQFFRDYDSFRYAPRNEGHILGCLDRINFAGKEVLEIGLGQGAESEQLIRRGAVWSGLDLTVESVRRVETRLRLRNLGYRSVKVGSVLQMPWDDGTFDMVFSHGVLHHVPDVRAASSEIRRVLKPDGELIVMLYARLSLNYLFSVCVIRRLGLLTLYSLGLQPKGILGEHIRNAREEGIWRYLRMSRFIHKNTDGPLNPYSKVYDVPTVKRDFSEFDVVQSYKCFMHAPPLPVHGLPLATLFGWHLWVHMRPKRT